MSNETILKSALAFFFLFFFHGFSIGTRQQGISYNVSWLCRRCGDLRPNLTNNN